MTSQKEAMVLADFPSGSPVFHPATARSGTLEEGGYLRFPDERVPPSRAQKMWAAKALDVAPLRRPRRPARPREPFKWSEGAQAASGGPQDRFQEAVERAKDCLHNSENRPWGVWSGPRSYEHLSGCQTAYGAELAPTAADRDRCPGCSYEHLEWTNRIAMLAELVRAFEECLESALNERLQVEPAVWQGVPLTLSVNRSVPSEVDWDAVCGIYGLLGKRANQDTHRARTLAEEFKQLREHHEGTPGWQERHIRLREAALGKRSLTRLFDGLAATVNRFETALTGGLAPDVAEAAGHGWVALGRS